MATLAYTCRRCGRAGEVFVGQSASGGRLRYCESFHCEHCGAAFEADGGEDAPAEVRAALLAEEGTWAVVVDRAPRVAVALRAVLGLGVAEAVALAGRLPGQVATGTRAEMLHLRDRLAELGVAGRVELVTPGAGACASGGARQG